MKVKKILLIIGIVLCCFTLIGILTLPICVRKINKASAYEVEGNINNAYTSPLFHNGYFIFDNGAFDNNLNDYPEGYNISTSLMPTSIAFDKDNIEDYPSTIRTNEGIYASITTTDVNLYDHTVTYKLTTDTFKPYDSSINPYLEFKGGGYYTDNMFKDIIKHSEIGLRTNDTIRYKLVMNFTNNSSSFFDEQGDRILRGLEIETTYQKYISLKDWVSDSDIRYLYGYANSYANIEVKFTIYLYDPNGATSTNPTTLSFISPYEQYNYLEGLESNPNFYEHTEIIEPSPLDIIIGSIDSFFNIEIFPNFKLSYLLMISTAVLMVGIGCKLFLGD